MSSRFLFTVRASHVFKSAVFFDFNRLAADSDAAAIAIARELLLEAVLDARFYRLSVIDSQPVIDL